jgi:hypothetical protein
MNRDNEEQHGILYISPEEAENLDYEPGHYFYDKLPSHRNARFFPFGYRVQIRTMRPDDIGEELGPTYADQYCSINQELVAIIDPLDNELELANYPMAQYLYNCISHGTETQGRGLRKIRFGSRYRYFPDFKDDVGGLREIE